MYGHARKHTVHDLLLQKGNGTFDLIVWDEKAKGSDSVTVLTERELASVSIYDPTLGTTPVHSLSRVRGITVTLSDHPLVLEIVQS